MHRRRVKKRKVITALITIVAAALILLSGTLAWQSLNQVALNEVASTVNPGGRLHDDFVDVTSSGNHTTMTFDKDVYVENFTSLATNGVQIFARIRLDEYMELGLNAGGDQAINKAESIIPWSSLEDKSTWRTRLPGDTEAENPFMQYWEWETGGGTVYMPTFNKDNGSKEADINGSFRDNFITYVDYSVDQQETKEATYSDKKVPETHNARPTLEGTVITMDTWNETRVSGNYWVWDEDGWAYWANPINPDRATGLLLDQISRTDAVINEDWYYGINVVAQFITGDALGDRDYTGFYDPKEGSPPSKDALILLSTIGVDVPIEVGSHSELQDALRRGGRIVLTKDIAATTTLVADQSATLELGQMKIYNLASIKDDSVCSLISVQGQGTTLTISGIVEAFEGDGYAVDVRSGAKVVINGGSFKGNTAAVYVSEGNVVINGGEFSIYPPADGDYSQMICADGTNFANGKAHITICGGTFHGFDPSYYVPDGYSVTQSGDTYTVSAN